MAVKKTTKKSDDQKIMAEMEKRAFEIYLERKKNDSPGDETTDWYQAEKEIREKHQAS